MTCRTSTSSLTAAASASQAGDEDIEEGNDGVDDTGENGSDSVDDGHETSTDGAEHASDLERISQINEAQDHGGRRKVERETYTRNDGSHFD
ncbi:hypothetical protein BHYA_0191g00090 [Botrytis hyacinthi]|uniref:Uncharacterized protein n=1 Tax=Botrytis hyacinthi TaxID=278943 RepID=A0A4Z1GL25_9HELO|nr:hypothetical protein BHYA_0191g00090 [Botrytis hyacinthi]